MAILYRDTFRRHAFKVSKSTDQSEARERRPHMPARGIILAIPIAAVLWALTFWWIGWL